MAGADGVIELSHHRDRRGQRRGLAAHWQHGDPGRRGQQESTPPPAGSRGTQHPDRGHAQYLSDAAGAHAANLVSPAVSVLSGGTPAGSSQLGSVTETLRSEGTGVARLTPVPLLTSICATGRGTDRSGR
jgi:hypothetical protein